MASGIGTIQVKRERGKLVLQGLGKTPRGQKFIRDTEPLSAKNMDSPSFKADLSDAVKDMLDHQTAARQ